MKRTQTSQEDLLQSPLRKDTLHPHPVEEEDRTHHKNTSSVIGRTEVHVGMVGSASTVTLQPPVLLTVSSTCAQQEAFVNSGILTVSVIVGKEVDPVNVETNADIGILFLLLLDMISLVEVLALLF